MNEQKESEIWLSKGGKLLINCMDSINEISKGDLKKFYLLITGFLHAKSEILVSIAISDIDPNVEKHIREIKIFCDEVFEDMLEQYKNKEKKGD